MVKIGSRIVFSIFRLQLADHRVIQYLPYQTVEGIQPNTMSYSE